MAYDTPIQTSGILSPNQDYGSGPSLGNGVGHGGSTHRGSRASPQTGDQHWEVAPALASLPMTSPISCSKVRSNVAAIEYGDGNSVCQSPCTPCWHSSARIAPIECRDALTAAPCKGRRCQMVQWREKRLTNGRAQLALQSCPTVNCTINQCTEMGRPHGRVREGHAADNSNHAMQFSGQ